MTSRKRNTSLVLFLFIFMAYAVSYVGRKGFSACMVEMDASLQLGKTICGFISTGFLFTYGAGQFFSGLIGDKVSPIRMITFGLLGVSISNLLMAFAPSPVLLILIWCLNGFFNSMLWPPVIRAIALWIPKEEQTRSATWISASLPAGSILSYLISSACLRWASWRISFVISSMIILSCCLIWYLGTRHYKEEIQKNESASLELSSKETTSSAKPSLSLWTCLIGTGLLFAVMGIWFNGMIKDGVTEWVPAYLADFFSITPSTASLLTGILPIVNLSGVFVASYINQKWTHNEMTTCAVLFLICALSLFLLFKIGSIHVILAVLLLGISTASMLGANNMFLTFIPLHFAKVGRSSSVTGLLDAMSYLFAALSSSLIGFLSGSFGWSKTMLFWVLGAVMGILICLIGAAYWKKGMAFLSQQSTNSDTLK